MISDPSVPPLTAAQRVLAVRLDNVGDLVMLGPALRALRAHLPDAWISLLCSPAGASVAPLLPWVDDLLVERVIWQDVQGRRPLDPAGEMALVRRLEAGRFDAALIFTSWSQSPWPAAAYCYLAGIPVRAGESKEFGGRLLTHQAPSLPDDVHQVDRNLHLLATLGISDADPALELRLPPSARDEAASLLAEHAVICPYVVVAPGASCAARRYPPARFAEVAEELVRSSDLPAVVVGSESEGELLAPVRWAQGAVDLVGRATVPGLAALLAGARLALTNDSGPMHLAAALGTPQVVLYSGTELVSQWAPRDVPAVLVRRPTACTPCHRFECPIGLACLDLPPSEVVAAALPLLADVERRCPTAG